jgi:HPt (histidine-containing phosphotransfer) domain-containing protein
MFVQRMMGDQGFAHEIAVGFLEELPVLMSTLRDRFAGEDIESIWKQAHKLKGSAANVGGEALSAVALELERTGQSGDMAAAALLLPEMEAQTARLQLELQQWAD